ncbi:MAG: hypothetical protein ACI3YK_06965 [Eubacteriales bacterium]
MTKLCNPFQLFKHQSITEKLRILLLTLIYAAIASNQAVLFYLLPGSLSNSHFCYSFRTGYVIFYALLAIFLITVTSLTVKSKQHWLASLAVQIPFNLILYALTATLWQEWFSWGYIYTAGLLGLMLPWKLPAQIIGAIITLAVIIGVQGCILTMRSVYRRLIHNRKLERIIGYSALGLIALPVVLRLIFLPTYESLGTQLNQTLHNPSDMVQVERNLLRDEDQELLSDEEWESLLGQVEVDPDLDYSDDYFSRTMILSLWVHTTKESRNPIPIYWWYSRSEKTDYLEISYCGETYYAPGDAFREAFPDLLAAVTDRETAS